MLRMPDEGFDRCNLHELPLSHVQAHGGEGVIAFHRVTEPTAMRGFCNFIDLAVLPPGTSIGRHTHSRTEEEFYLVLAGSGTMWRDGAEFPVHAGDLIRTPPGGSHSLANHGSVPLRIFVFELRVEP